MSEREAGYAMYEIPPGHMPMVLLTPEQYQRLNEGVSRTPSLFYFAMSQIGHTIQDIARELTQFDLLSNHLRPTGTIDKLFHINTAYATYSRDIVDPRGPWSASKTPLEDGVKTLADALESGLPTLMDLAVGDWIKGIAAGMGGAYASAVEQLTRTGQLLDAWKGLQLTIGVYPWMRRHWLRELTPAIPDASMAWILLRRGKITDQQFGTYASFDGWGSVGIDFLKTAWNQIPNENTAFRMWARGAIDSKTKEAFYYANSWEKDDFSNLDAVYQWLPNAREAFTLFRRGHIPENTMQALMKAQGYLPEWHEYLPSLYERILMPRDAFNAYLRGTISKKLFEEYVEQNEWRDGSADILASIYQNLPSARDAFTLFKRGHVPKNTMEGWFKADGYLEDLHGFLPKIWERIPHPRDAFNGLMRGVIDRKMFDHYVEENEWRDGMADFLYGIYAKQPSAHEAFYMWAKGIITLQQRDELYKANGYDSEWHTKLTDNYYYVPTVYDLTRIADFVEVDAIWATKILKERGLRASDISKIIQMLKVRPLRDEIRRQIAIWVKRYRYGWVTATQLDAALQDYLENGFIQATEKDFTVQEAELNYEDELMEEKIEIYSWYFKTAVISEEELLEDFLDLGIREEKANLMVENLKAQGYYGYY